MAITSALEKLAVKLNEICGSEQIANRTDYSNNFQIALIIIGSFVVLASSIGLAIFYWKHYEKKISACILIALGILSSIVTFLSSLISASLLILVGIIGALIIIFYWADIWVDDVKQTSIYAYYFLYGAIIMQLPVICLIGKL